MALRSALGLFGMVMLLVGIGFLTAAGWIALRLVATPLDAALIVGGCFAGFGVLVLLIARIARPRRPVVAPPAMTAQSAQVQAFATIAAAFVQGIGAGLAARRR
ncbi:hypothetical protein [Psychromarinibacter halotolerans]|uniref:Superfamily III holin-X n=1 Tax=Psychromarinibacter halotolerans TaxID=1775175 RepID=A0ABV7GS66_9RHOB|nr:hypothetical protein [Psychromarinibacter halotolerans]MAQ83322.1 hypothetical protein [Maritimibacter sp.]MDF0595630.1 hypothetical protein [Psychromarinibacter halotolerans]